ncbi:MAG: CpaD family pilus assembly protein [Pseudomonadota bacterium]
MRNAAIALLGLASAAFAGCAPLFNDELEALTYKEQHPISIDPQNVAMEIVAEQVGSALSVVDRARVRSFALDYVRRGHGPITVVLPSGSQNAMASVEVAADIYDALHAAGLERGAVKGATYRAPASSDDAAILVSFTRYVATSTPCGVWDQNIGLSLSNTVTSNFGCATQQNLAAIVADPRDLVAPRGVSAADVGRRATVLQRYREGEITSTERDQQATGILSEAVE